MSSALTLKYVNDDDRAYGLAGMAISLAALDALDRVVDVSLDSDGPMVTFTHEYYFCGSPTLSPKAVWSNMLNSFNLTATMALSNVMARSLVRLGSDVPDDVMDSIHKAVVEEGIGECSLEEDEVDRMYERARTYMRRIFNNRRLHPAIDELVRTLAVRRRLTGTEIADELRLLQII